MNMFEKRVGTAHDCPMCGAPDAAVKFVKEYMARDWSLRLCQKCGLHFTDPSPTAEFLDQCYAGDYHAELRVNGGAEHAFGAKYQRYLEWLVNYLPAGGRVLDIGCSTGLLVQKLCQQGYRAEGLELNGSSAEWGRQHYNITIHNKLLEDCTFASGSFDAVLMTDVLEHTLNPRDFLASVGEYLSPNGFVFITFPDIQSLESHYYFLLSKLMQRPRLWRNCHIPLHVWEFTKATAKACFESAGFCIISFRRSHELAEDGAQTGLRRLINFPPGLISWSPMASVIGTQMEFIIRRQ